MHFNHGRQISIVEAVVFCHKLAHVCAMFLLQVVDVLVRIAQRGISCEQCFCGKVFTFFGRT